MGRECRMHREITSALKVQVGKRQVREMLRRTRHRSKANNKIVLTEIILYVVFCKSET